MENEINCSGFLLILLIESAVHKFFGGGHGHSHFPSQETLARRFVAVEVSCKNTFPSIQELNCRILNTFPLKSDFELSKHTLDQYPKPFCILTFQQKTLQEMKYL